MDLLKDRFDMVIKLFEDEENYPDEQLKTMAEAYRQVIEQSKESGERCREDIYIVADAIDQTMKKRNITGVMQND